MSVKERKNNKDKNEKNIKILEKKDCEKEYARKKLKLFKKKKRKIIFIKGRWMKTGKKREKRDRDKGIKEIENEVEKIQGRKRKRYL